MKKTVQNWIEDNPKKFYMIAAAVVIIVIGVLAGHGVS